jgi:hypothetical protein
MVPHRAYQRSTQITPNGIVNTVTSKEATQRFCLLLCPYPSCLNAPQTEESRQVMQTLINVYIFAVRMLEKELRKLDKQINSRPVFLVQETATADTILLTKYVQNTRTVP